MFYYCIVKEKKNRTEIFGMGPVYTRKKIIRHCEFVWKCENVWKCDKQLL